MAAVMDSSQLCMACMEDDGVVDEGVDNLQISMSMSMSRRGDVA
jgi:hypothetical protein